MGRSRIVRVSYEKLRECTDDFSDENYIGKFQFGKVYRGKIQDLIIGTRELIVKIWEDALAENVVSQENESRLMDEVYLLQHEQVNDHPTLVKLAKYCCEGEKLGIIYELNSLDTVYNLVDKDSFTWLHRVKVAFGIACLLKFLHAQVPPYLPFLVRNIDAAHIMVDKDYNPKLFDFGMISGGIFPDRTKYQTQYCNGHYGFSDPYCGAVGAWSEKCDVFAFGILLLMLIAKRVDSKEERFSCDVPSVYDWARSQYKPKRSIMGFHQYGCSLVHRSLEAESDFCPSDGPKITKLAMRCVEYDPKKRPSMRKVVKDLQHLHVVRCHAQTLGLDQMLRGYADADADDGW